MGKKNKVNISGLADALKDALEEYGYVAEATVREACDETASETAANISAAAPGKIYPGTWTSGLGKSKKDRYSTFVYADAPGYRLAHLLEHGHLTRSGDRKVGQRIHIAPQETKASDILANKFRQKMKG